MKYITPYITATSSHFLSNINTGLGNVLFQIASCYGISKDLKLNIFFDNVITYCHTLYNRFGFNHGDTILRNFYKKDYEHIPINITLFERQNYNKQYDTELINNIINSDNSVIYGYLENINYFSNYFDEIKESFSIDDISYNSIIKNYGNILESKEYIPVSIHFRGNEYIAASSTKSYNYDFYNRAIDYINTEVKNPYYLIFTDDINAIEFNKIVGMDKYIVVKNEYDYLDLWTMSMCKHNISSFSTFSWWGAFLNKNNNKIVLYNRDDKKDLNYSLFTPV